MGFDQIQIYICLSEYFETTTEEEQTTFKTNLLNHLLFLIEGAQEAELKQSL